MELHLNMTVALGITYQMLLRPFRQAQRAYPRKEIPRLSFPLSMMTGRIPYSRCLVAAGSGSESAHIFKLGSYVTIPLRLRCCCA